MSKVVSSAFAWIGVLLLLLSSSLSAMVDGSTTTAAKTTYPALFFAPGYLSKAATVTADQLKTSLRGYTHAAETGRSIPAATQCNMKHDLLAVDSVDFSDLRVTATNATHVQVVVQNITPLKTKTGSFHVQCDYNGAFVGALELPQNGSVHYSVDFGPQLQYNTSYVVLPNGTVTLTDPVLVHKVKATPTYKYDSNGFALDAFVASYFESVVAPNIEKEITEQLLTYPAPFAKPWFEAAKQALSVTEFVCGTDFIPESSASVFWLQPGCGPNPTQFRTHKDLLLTNDMLLLIPSSDGLQQQQEEGEATAATGSSVEGKLLEGYRRQMKQLLQVGSKIVRASASASSCSPVAGCSYKVNTTNPALSVTFSNCTVCYPEDGRYTEFAAVAAFSGQ